MADASEPTEAPSFPVTSEVVTVLTSYIVKGDSPESIAAGIGLALDILAGRSKEGASLRQRLRELLIDV